jgi:hypothetical protein
MRKVILAAAVAALLPAVASAQDTRPAIDAYFGVLGGGDGFTNRSDFGTVGNRGAMNGSLVEAVGGVNIPLGGAFFVGGEGNVAKGIKDIDWEYGARGRVGLMTGSTGMIFLTAGHEWVNGRRGFANHDNWTYGGGVEVSPAGLSSGFGPRSPRLRIQVETYDFQSIRPMAGIIFGF